MKRKHLVPISEIDHAESGSTSGLVSGRRTRQPQRARRRNRSSGSKFQIGDSCLRVEGEVPDLEYVTYQITDILDQTVYQIQRGRDHDGLIFDNFAGSQPTDLLPAEKVVTPKNEYTVQYDALSKVEGKYVYDKTNGHIRSEDGSQLFGTFRMIPYTPNSPDTSDF